MEYSDAHYKTYNNYLKLQSEEWKNNIDYFKPLECDIELPHGAYRETAIKVVLKDGNWLRVYFNENNNSFEWY